METPSENKSITEPSERKGFVLKAGWRLRASGNPATDRIWGKAGVSGLFNLKQAFMRATAPVPKSTGPSETNPRTPDENKVDKPKKKKGKKKKSAE